MEASAATRVLVVEYRTGPTQSLIDAVRQRARRGPCSFTLLVPNPARGLHKVVDPEDQSSRGARSVLEETLPALQEAVGAPIEGIVGDADPVAAVEDAINLHGFDEVILSTQRPRISRLLKLDLASKVAGMGLPLTTITTTGEHEPVTAP